MKISIIVGAGSSNECGTDYNNKPIPLGRDLYCVLKYNYPQSWGKYIPKELESLFKNDFEQGMLSLWQKTPEYFTQLLIDMAIYFSYCKPNKLNNYVAIIDSLIKNQLIQNTNIVSLNYECVFELLLNYFKYGICIYGDYDNSKAVRVWKPHGSCNFLPNINATNVTIDPGPNNPSARYFETDGLPKVATMEEVRRFLGLNSIPPFMSLYEPNKNTLSGESFINKIRDMMAQSLLESDFIISIGVNPNFNDKHIWNPVINSKAIIWYVGTSNNNFAKLKSKVGARRLCYLGKKFHESTPRLQFLLKSISN